MRLPALDTSNHLLLPAFAVVCFVLGLVFPLVGTGKLRGTRKLGIVLGCIILGLIVAVCGWVLRGTLGGADSDLFIYGILLVVLIVILFATCIVVDVGQPASFSQSLSHDLETQQRNQIIAEIPVGVWKLGPGGYTTTINDEMCRILEVDRPDDTTGLTYHAFFTPDSLNILNLETFSPAEPVPRIAECEIVGRSGRKRLVSIKSFPEFDARVQAGFYLIVQDVTETRALETENGKLTTLPKFCPFPIMSFTSSGHLIYFNESARELARTLGSEGDLAILPLDMQEIIKNCIASGQTRLQHEINLRGRTISWSFFPVKEAQVVHCYAMEITQRLTMETQLRQSQRMESVGQLAGGIAHDLNNLLNVIMGYTGLLQLRTDGRKEETNHLNRIAEATERAADLTQHLLTFSRKQVIQPKTLDLNEVLNAQNKIIQGILGSTVTLQCTYAPNLPPVQIDEGMVEQIVTNLASNSKDAMHNGGQLIISTRVVDIDAKTLTDHPDGREGRFVCLSVADSGDGIDSELLPRIFEPFFSTKSGGKERGLGLAEVLGAVKQHRGWIEVSSQLRQGATFRIFLPTTPQEWLDTTNELPSEELPKVEGGAEKILIVEDEPALLALASNVLESYGYHILTAVSAEEAIEKWDGANGDVDLVLTDVVMPSGMGGSDLAKYFRGEKPSLKIIYTSGFNREILNTSEPIEEGVNFLPKPYLSAALGKAVRAQLDKRQPEISEAESLDPLEPTESLADV